MKIKSFAKINLGLEILHKRGDGYHEIRTLFQSVDFYDVMVFREIKANKIVIEGDNDSIPWDENNLAFKAASLLKEEMRKPAGVEIQVQKRIPPGSGLGGGSSNAAMTLYALNGIWKLGYDIKELMEKGRELGSDVPYFLEGGLCLGEGRGDILSPAEDLKKHYCLLILPPLFQATEAAYKSYPASLTSRDKDSKIIKFLQDRDISILENDLEGTALRFHPRLEDIKRYLQSCQAPLSLVSGTGSAVFGFFRERERAEKAMSSYCYEDTLHLIETVSREEYWDCLSTGV
jgi:4-diphosphocytidyl-2-C-methyl-D-erythritol kinase